MDKRIKNIIDMHVENARKATINIIEVKIQEIIEKRNAELMEETERILKAYMRLMDDFTVENANNFHDTYENAVLVEERLLEDKKRFVRSIAENAGVVKQLSILKGLSIQLKKKDRKAANFLSGYVDSLYIDVQNIAKSTYEDAVVANFTVFHEITRLYGTSYLQMADEYNSKLNKEEITEEEQERIETDKILDFRKMDALLRSKGYEVVRKRGSHVMYSNGVITIPVPFHSGGAIKAGTSYAIQKQAQ